MSFDDPHDTDKNGRSLTADDPQDGIGKKQQNIGGKQRELRLKIDPVAFLPKRTPTTVTQVFEISPKNEPVSGPLLH
jgi:hypothetical protein